jgi:hypothetical protein
MSVIDKIDAYIESTSKKKVIKEEIGENDFNSDVINFLNSIDDSMLDDEQIELKNKILSANVETVTDDYPEDDDDDIVIDDVDDIDITGNVNPDEIGTDDIDLDTIIDVDVPKLSSADDFPEDDLTGKEMEDEYFDPDKYKIEGKKVKKTKKVSPKKAKYKEPERVGKSKKKK